MKRWVLTLGAVTVVAALLGCLPEKRVVWSPDGQRAAVVGSDGLYLCGEDGQLSPRVAEGVRRVAWLPDSRRLVVARQTKARTWQDVLPCFTEERRAQVTALAERTRVKILAYEGEWDDFEPEELDELTDGEKGAVLLFLRDECSESLPEKLGEKWEELRDVEINVWSLELLELDGGEARPIGVIFRTPDEVLQPRVSPDGEAVAFVGPAPTGEDNSAGLYVAAVAGGGAARPVAERVAFFPDWSPDGRELVFVQTDWQGNETLGLGAIKRVRIRDEAGKLLDEFASAGELAGVVFQPEMKVRWLRDGRVVFATMEISLPCAAEDMPQNASLFVVQPDKSPLVTRLVPRQSEAELPDGVFLFEVSPDGRHVAIPGSEGEVCILTLATGSVWTPIDPKVPDEFRMVPVWRSAEELCATVGPAAASGRAAVVLLKLDWPSGSSVVRKISVGWPDAVVRGLLLPEEEGAEK